MNLEGEEAGPGTMVAPPRHQGDPTLARVTRDGQRGGQLKETQKLIFDLSLRLAVVLYIKDSPYFSHGEASPFLCLRVLGRKCGWRLFLL